MQTSFIIVNKILSSAFDYIAPKLFTVQQIANENANFHLKPSSSAERKFTDCYSR